MNWGRPNNNLYRNGMLDLWRLVFCILVGFHHLYYISIPEPYPFFFAWIYVEFFFIVTGYYTAAHFEKVKNTGNVVEDVISYTYIKFKNYFPYVFIAVTSYYIIEIIITRSYITLLSIATLLPDYVCELFLVNATGYNYNHLGPMWYMSALFVTFPIICLLLRDGRTNKIYKTYLSWLIPTLYYGKYGLSGAGICGNLENPHKMLRAIACMSLGVFTFQVVSYISKITRDKEVTVWERAIFTTIEAASLITTIYITKNNMTDYGKEILFLFVIGLICNLSGLSYTYLIRGTFFDFLGVLSFVFYLMQGVVALLVNVYLATLGAKMRVIVYFAITIIISCAEILIINLMKLKSRRHAKW